MMKSEKRQRFLRINRWQRQSIKLSVAPALALFMFMFLLIEIFQPELSDVKMPIDMILALPGGVAGEPPSRLRCQGAVVRTTPAAEADVPATVAATVGDYRLTAT